MRTLVAAVSAVCLMSFGVRSGAAATDPRFFGTYCGEATVESCARYRVCFFLGWPCVTRTRCERVDIRQIRVNVGYSERRGFGVINGGGTAQVDGRSLILTLNGVISAGGHARGIVASNFFDPNSGIASLSDDGVSLTVYARGKSLTIRKDLCGNSPPSAVIISPVPAAIPWGQPITFVGTASDPEDPSFPDERLVWSSSRDGRLGTGLSIARNFLSHGTHTISFGVTDSGGLSVGHAIQLSIDNNPPSVPLIKRPQPDATFFSGHTIWFKGEARDREQASLALSWRSNLLAEDLGYGELFRRTLSEGSHTITLSATDNNGAASSTSIRIRVVAPPAGNTPPSVAITFPRNYSGTGDRDCVVLVAEASDLQDGRLSEASLIWEDRYFDGRVELPRRIPDAGERIEVCDWPTTGGHDTWHTIRVTATDSGGLSATDELRVYVIPGGLF